MSVRNTAQWTRGQAALEIGKGESSAASATVCRRLFNCTRSRKSSEATTVHGPPSTCSKLERFPWPIFDFSPTLEFPSKPFRAAYSGQKSVDMLTYIYVRWKPALVYKSTTIAADTIVFNETTLNRWKDIWKDILLYVWIFLNWFWPTVQRPLIIQCKYTQLIILFRVCRWMPRQLQWWLKYLALWFRFASERYLGSSVGSWERKTGNGEWPMGNGAMTTNGQPQCARRTLHRLQAFLTMPPLRCCVAVLIQNQQFLRFSGRLNMFKHSLRWRSSLGASN